MSQAPIVAPVAGRHVDQPAKDPSHDMGPQLALLDVSTVDSQHAWAMFPTALKSSKDVFCDSCDTAPPPYTDDPQGVPATIYIFADASAAEAQAAAARRSVVHDLLVILLQLVLLLMLGLLAYRWYHQFNADWRRTHMHIIKAEAERRMYILNQRALAMQTT